MLAEITPSEAIERKARHFVHWYPTTEARLQQLEKMAAFAGHFNPQWKTTNMVSNATNLFAALARHGVHYLVIGGFAALEHNQAVYLVIGGYAARAYGVPRFTDDVDLFIESSPDNIRRVMDALVCLGSDQAQIFNAMNSTIVTFLEIDDLPLKTDIMVNVPGLDFANAWQHVKTHHLEGQKVYLVARADLIKSKRAAGRWQDLEDVKALEATSENDTSR